jgi:excisionase family DNA binding protein
MSEHDSTPSRDRSHDARSSSRTRDAATDTPEPPAHSSRQLVTIDELSEWLQVPKQTVYKWRSCGSGPRALRIGKHVRFEIADVERWLVDHRET